ncbi:MAG: hypothetical protein HRT55_19890 [Colwellia sp.]|uniref:hypothetical protein n=1 Tax=Colwellia sp. TaxID=56799 RepID=UPI0025BE1DDB|nr:hypothetical protein [Colwellia sp.]NQZ28566.1 hypothetical protein [Colwellia sp.]
MKVRNIRMDDLATFSYFTIIAVTLLFSLGYFAGNAGFVISSFLISIAVYFAVVWGKNLGRSFANAPADTSKVEGESMMIALACLCYSAYLSLGLHSLALYFKEGVALEFYFYFWLLSFSLPILFLVLRVSYRRFTDK